MNDIQQAVINKLTKIFESTDHIREVDINIHGSAREHTTIRYEIEEFVVPEVEPSFRDDEFMKPIERENL